MIQTHNYTIQKFYTEVDSVNSSEFAHNNDWDRKRIVFKPIQPRTSDGRQKRRTILHHSNILWLQTHSTVIKKMMARPEKISLPPPS